MLPTLSSNAYGALETLGVPGLMRSWRNAAPILCYHNVVPARHPATLGDPSLHLPVDRFANQIRWLARQYVIVPLEEIIERLANGDPVRRLAAITFDDAYAGVFQYAWPILKDRHIPATVFVVAQAAETGESFWWDHPDTAGADDEMRERWLTDYRGDGRKVLPRASRHELPLYMRAARWDAITAAAREGLALGAHSMTHRALPTLTQREITFEVVPARGVIQHRTGFDANVFSYPYGLFDDRTRDAVRSAGYTAGMSLDPALNHAGGDRWALNRINVPASLPSRTFEAWTAGLVPPHRNTA